VRRRVREPLAEGLHCGCEVAGLERRAPLRHALLREGRPARVLARAVGVIETTRREMRRLRAAETEWDVSS